MVTRRRHAVLVILLTTLVALSGMTLQLSTSTLGRAVAFAQAPDPTSPTHAPARRVGAVYVMTNALTGNAVVVYHRAANGELTLVDEYPTGGLGAGTGVSTPEDPLGSQNALVRHRRWLFAVNAGSDEISVFRIRRHWLELVDTVNSGGDYPVSLTVKRRVLYVLNAGGDGNITGFHIGRHGQLTPLEDSTRSLNAATPPEGDQVNVFESPGQVGFSPRGDWLVVTDKGMVSGQGRILVFAVDPEGRPAAEPVVTLTAGLAPFAFTFDRHGHLLVTDAIAELPPSDPPIGDVTSYTIASDGSLTVLDQQSTHQGTTCWIAGAPNGRYQYVSNTATHTISGLRVASDGALELLNADGVTAAPGGGALPIDVALSRNGKFLYALTPGLGTISVYQVHPDGSLTALEPVEGLPVLGGTEGLVAR